ncbi:MAG TPA: Mur ligase domain-containing protein, partial [Herpetosiphonaceae bacterium]
MTITRHELIAGAAARETAGDLSRPIGGLAYDSRQVEPGFAFAAVRGFHVDGHDYIPKALAAGAAAVIYDRADWRDGAGRG